MGVCMVVHVGVCMVVHVDVCSCACECACMSGRALAPERYRGV